MAGRRLSDGGAVDRSSPIGFRFGGRELTGYAGDTLATALLANGVDVIGPSPIQGRPRGVMTAGVDEPNAFVEVAAPWFDADRAATMVELVDGLVAEPRPGVGRLPADPLAVAAPRVDHRHRHVETLVVGGGPAGVDAADEAARRGDRVMLVDDRRGWAGRNADRRPRMASRCCAAPPRSGSTTTATS